MEPFRVPAAWFASPAAHHLPWQRPGVAAVVDHQRAVDGHVVDTHRVLLWVVEGGRGVHRVGVEQDQVRFCAVADEAAVGEAKALREPRRSSCGRLPPARTARRCAQTGTARRIGAVGSRVGAAAGEDGVSADHLGGWDAISRMFSKLPVRATKAT